MRTLRTAVVAGGVLYPAGTRSTPDLVELIADRHWAGEEYGTPAPDVTQSDEYRDLTAQLDSLREDYNTVTAAYADLRSTAEQLVIERDAALERATKGEADLAEAMRSAGAEAVVDPSGGNPAGDPSPVKRTRQRNRSTTDED